MEPPWSDGATTATDCTLHQLAPYIGRMKTSIARYLVETYTRRGDTILDPFCGSGVVPLEAALAGRNVVCGDVNPYGIALTRAKLFAPHSESAAYVRWQRALKAATSGAYRQDLRRIPLWVREFFHPETLREALAVRDVLSARQEYLLLGCLLGILHHQRPGFLSVPSSHLVPYRRTRLFPADQYPEMYARREVGPRMLAKIHRSYRRTRPLEVKASVTMADARCLKVRASVDAIITSPPYMNELDYVRDNRLRLWFLDRQLPDVLDIPRRDRMRNFETLMRDSLLNLAPNVRTGGHIVLVVGDGRRGGQRLDTAEVVSNVFRDERRLSHFQHRTTIVDCIPDIRRSRRERLGTKSETFLVFQRRA